MSEDRNEFTGLSYNAADWFLKAARQGHKEAKEKLDEIMKNPSHWNSTIVSMVTEKAEAGDIEAQYDLGRYYTHEKIFLPQPIHQENMAQAIEWFGKAAAQSHEDAKEKLALLVSLKTTHEKAKAGDADAQYQIGVWQSEGGNEMVCMDNSQAIMWFRKAGEQSHEKAKDKYAELKKNPKNWDSRLIMSGGVEK